MHLTILQQIAIFRLCLVGILCLFLCASWCALSFSKDRIVLGTISIIVAPIIFSAVIVIDILICAGRWPQ